MKGLVSKWAVWPNSSKEAHEECERLRATKLEYATDEEGRLWRRIFRRELHRKGFYTKVDRWHVADMYDWFPGRKASEIPGARQQNTRARPPKRLDVYLIQGRPSVFVRNSEHRHEIP